MTGLFMLWTLFIIWKARVPVSCGRFPLHPGRRNSSRSRRSSPFLAIIVGVMYVLYGGNRDALGGPPGVGAALCVVMPLSSTACGARKTGGRSCATRRASR